jgi:N utilization substance protein A
MVTDPNREISLTEARKIEPDYEVGEDVPERFYLHQLGRRDILALRQNLNSKVYEHDSSNIYKEFKEREGQLYTAEVHHIRRNMVVLLDDEGVEIILPKSEQIKSDFYRKGDNVTGIIKLVELKGNKPNIIMSRTSDLFLKRLFEREIPEVTEGLITIEAVARFPGEKAKIAVDSYDERIDPVGACVGLKGSRIHGIVRELGNENIDVINYSKNDSIFIQRALSPAQIQSIKLYDIDPEEENDKDEAGKEKFKYKGRAEVFLRGEEVSKAIGKKGVNIHLASKLTGYKIDVQREDVDEEDVELIEFADEIDRWVIDEFRKVGLDTAKSILNRSLLDLVTLTDLEEETVIEVRRILKEELDKE